MKSNAEDLISRIATAGTAVTKEEAAPAGDKRKKKYIVALYEEAHDAYAAQAKGMGLSFTAFVTLALKEYSRKLREEG